MKYIIMCGGTYPKWSKPRQLISIGEETIVTRTIRLLREAGEQDIAISSNDPAFDDLGVPVLHHDNSFVGYETRGYWHECFYPMNDPACYLLGDVIFSPEAIRTIVDTQTDDIELFASAPPFGKGYRKRWSEPFAFKVVNQAHLRDACKRVEVYDQEGRFRRRPIAWELWQVIKDTPLNIIRPNYTVINDYTCDIDDPEDISHGQMDLYRGYESRRNGTD